MNGGNQKRERQSNPYPQVNEKESVDTPSSFAKCELLWAGEEHRRRPKSLPDKKGERMQTKKTATQVNEYRPPSPWERKKWGKGDLETTNPRAIRETECKPFPSKKKKHLTTG